MRDFKRLLAYAKPYGRYWPGYLILSIFSVIFSVINFTMIGPLLDVLFNPDTIEEQLSIPSFALTIDYIKDVFSYYLTIMMRDYGYMSGLLFVCSILITASFIANLTRYLSQRILINMRTNIMQNIRRALFNKISSLNVGYFTTQRKGDILSSISNDVTEVQNGYDNNVHGKIYFKCNTCGHKESKII